MGREWVVILGVSSGFGAAAARAYAEAGYGIFGVHLDRRSAQPAIEAQQLALNAHGVPVHFVNGNAASDEVRASALKTLGDLWKEGDRVRVLLHSIAFGTLRPLVGEGALERRQLEMTIDVMGSSLVYWVQGLLGRGWLAAGSRVFAMTSAGSLVAWPSYAAVSAAKSVLESYVRQLAVELAPKQITVNAIMAGVPRTPALEKIPGSEEITRHAEARNPHGRLTTPDDVASCLVSLTDAGTAWLTGNVLRVDGGEAIAG